MAIIQSNSSAEKDFPFKTRPKARKPKLHYYSPSMAEQLNPKQPDITAATLLTNLAYWQDNFYPSTLIDGRRHSFRSLSQLAKDCPYLTKPAIHKALQRLEEKLGAEFVINRNKDVLYFSIGDETLKKLQVTKRTRKEKEDESTKKYSFLPADAIMTKSIRSAVLLANLKHQISTFRKPLQDEAGNKYGELSPKKLESVMGFSEDTISRAVNEMCKKRYLLPHDTKRSFFRIPNELDAVAVPKPGKMLSAEVHEKTADVHNPPAEVNARPAEIHSQPAEVHSSTLSKRVQSIDHQQSAEVLLPGCINECVNTCGNESLKEIIKDSNNTARTSPVCVPSKLSEGLMTLMNSAEARLAKMRSEEKTIKDHPTVYQDELPYEVVDPYELAYEVVSERERTFQAELNEGIGMLKYSFKDSGQIVTADDEAKFRLFLTDNPKVDALDLWDLYQKVIHPPLVFTSMKDQESHPPGILTKVKTPTQFLKYLPQILVLLNWDGDEESSWHWVDEPFINLNFAYLGDAPNSSIVTLDDGTVPSELIEE